MIYYGKKSSECRIELQSQVVIARVTETHQPALEAYITSHWKNNIRLTEIGKSF